MIRYCTMLIFLLLYLTDPGKLQADNRYYFKHLGIEDGMSQNSVLYILQDSKGFMWFATKDGVNRYDGVQFKRFFPDKDYRNFRDCVMTFLWEAQDGKIWTGTERGVSIYDPETEKFTVFEGTTSDNIAITHRIYGMIQDKAGKIWIADEVGGVFCYDPRDGKLIRPAAEDAGFVRIPKSFLIDGSGTLWVGTGCYGFYFYDAENNIFRSFRTENTDVKELDITSMVESGREIYLATFNKGLWKLNKENRQLIPVLTTDEKRNPLHIHRLVRSAKNEIWIGSEVGLYIYEEETGKGTHFQQSYIDRYALSDNAIYCFCKDREGGMWLGTYFGGVNYSPYQYTPFSKYYPLNDGKTVSGKAVREFCEDSEGNIWIGTEDAGLNRFDPRTGTFRHYLPAGPGSIHYHNIHALQIDKDRLWIGTYTGGLDLMDLKTGQIRHYGKDKAPAEVFSLLKDRTGRIWLGAFGGAYTYRPEKDRFERIEEIGSYFIYDIREDDQGNLWFAAHFFGVIRYNPVNGEMVRYEHDRNDKTSIAAKIIGIFEDSRRRLWFVSEGEGICRFDPENGKFVRYSVEEGLPSNVVYNMVEDRSGNLWCGTNRGLLRFDPEKKKMKIYTRENGLLCDQFNYKSAFLSKNGTIYMGTVNGFISFDPTAFREDKSVFSPILTGFQIFNKEVPIGGDSPLKKSIALTRELHLKYNQNTLSFDFAFLRYNTSEMHGCLYKLGGLDKDWLHMKQQQKITYSNLSPGNYLLQIRPLDPGGEGCSLKIRISPPFWLSSYAYMLYFLSVMLLVYGAFRVSAKRIEERHRRSLEQLENQKEKEAYDAKIGFFTNVAHEVRTPLSLIKGPLEQVLKENKVDADTREELQVMERNTERLLNLINQLLDFRKTEAGRFSLTFMRYDITALLKEVYERFVPTFRRREIDFRIHFPETAFFADVDREAFTKIISNLLTNASKFTRSFIGIELQTVLKDVNCFRIIMKNDGKLIPSEMSEKIFEPFFRIDEENGENTKTGTGIGLPLSRSLAELHKGRLFIENQSAACNTFVLELPVRQENVIETDVVGSSLPVTEDKMERVKPEKYGLLVVEDNSEMQDFLYRQLTALYTVFRAGNGKEALEKLDKEHVDMVVSDVMMPEMDGFELLKNIKSDVKNSHIPVILLTARANLPSKIEGLELGADAYIEKPFSMDYLSVQIANLLEGRKKLRDSFIRSPYLHANTIALTKADEEFMEKINAVVERNLENADFNIDQLAKAVNTSRSSLLRKIKGISELTANEYIRLVRLKKAAQLLEEGRYRINEICFLTGFSSSSYFAKCFQKQFGILPKDLVNRRKVSKE